MKICLKFSILVIIGGLLLACYTGQKNSGDCTLDWNNNGIPDMLVGGEDGHFFYAGR